MESDELPLPRKHGIFSFVKGASCGIEPHALHACLDHVPDHAHRGFQTFHEGIFCLGEIDWTVSTFVNDTAAMILCSVGRMILHVRRVAYRALESQKFHVIALILGLIGSMTYDRHSPICPERSIT